MAAVDEAFAVGTGFGVEVHFGRVLPQTGGHHVLGLAERHAVDVIDLLPHLVVAPVVRLPGGDEVVAGEVQAVGNDQVLGCDRVVQLGHDRVGGRRVGVALVHHHPADPVDRYVTVLVGGG